MQSLFRRAKREVVNQKGNIVMSCKLQLTPINIVSYRMPEDVAACLISLDALQPESAISAHIRENGGERNGKAEYNPFANQRTGILANEISISYKHDFRRVASHLNRGAF